MTEDEKRAAYARLGILDWIENRAKIEAEHKRNDPMNIVRYNDAAGGVEHAPEGQGDYVTYEDHLRIVNYLKQEISNSYQRGKSDGADTHSWRL